MAREIGYFKYVNRSSVKLYGSGVFDGIEDSGYVYGWNDLLGDFTLISYLKTFTPDTNDAKAGLQLRVKAKSNMSYFGIYVTGNNKIQVQSRNTTSADTLLVEDSSISVHQNIWFKITKTGNIVVLSYSLDYEGASVESITWVNVHTFTNFTIDWIELHKYLYCSSGSDNVNLAYFIKVFTEECYVSPDGQKEG
jgi:hypothetical protein